MIGTLGNCERVCQVSRVESLDGNRQALGQKVVSRGSVVASVKRLPICAGNSWALTLTGPSVSRATGKKSWVTLRELYFVVFLAAAVSVSLFIYLMHRIRCST